MGLTSKTIVFQRGLLGRKPPVGGVLRVGRRSEIGHVIVVREGKSKKVERGNYHSWV